MQHGMPHQYQEAARASSCILKFKKNTHRQNNSLQTLEMFVCYGMITKFPMKLWRVLENLETVVLHGCKSVQEVFQLDGLNQPKKELLSLFKTLNLEYVPELRCTWKGPTHHVNLKSLTYLKLDGCSKLTSIFSPWLAESLVQLETLDISQCKQLEHIIAEKDEERLYTFPGSHVRPVGLQNLKTLKIYECDRLTYIFPVSIAKNLLHLEEEISIASAAELKQFFGKGESSVSSGVENDLLCQSEAYSSRLGYFCSGNSSAWRNLKKQSVRRRNTLQ
ncbi:uncharacterized protein LOC125371050 isoform X1 [Ricinus communis]|uniref:uncharacterized protein LOC125371050 isoform X1 n=1 Tax=Ricinus communis TaxID=3988 RepID=UPI000772B72C|nr:uncharacterized protein LOC125371050 isoform X1 [Ricinus communis]